MNHDYLGLGRILLPEACLVLGALVAMTVDIAAGRGWSERARIGVATAIGLIAVCGASLACGSAGSPGEVFGRVLMADPAATAARLGILLLLLLTLGITAGARLVHNPAEYVALVLCAGSGFMLMAMANHLLVAFVAVELASLCLYVAIGFDRTRPASAEAGLKYFLYGGMAAAFMLFGFSLIYGLTGSLDLSRIAAVLSVTGLSPLLAAALVLVTVGLGFKTASAPFHLWAPDAYQGGPPQAAALVASASKLASLVLFTRLFWAGLGPVAGELSYQGAAPGWVVILALLSGLSLLVGNVAALVQTDVRRLLAYSAIAHAGTLLLGAIVAGKAGAAPAIYYALTYGIATVGAFGVVAALDATGGGMRIADLAGLGRRSPLLAGCMAVFILSLAGIPPLAGFFGKFAVFAAALQYDGIGGGAGMLAIAAIGMSAVALYYYLVVLKQVFVAESDGADRKNGAIAVGMPMTITLLAAAGLLVGLGIFPSLVLRLAG